MFRRVIAYYDLICASRRHPVAYFLRPPDTNRGERVPNLVYVSVRACHPQHPGGPIGSYDCYFPDHTGLRHIRNGSTSTSRARWFSRGLCNEAESGSLALRPARLLALHQQGLLLPSFRRPDHSEPTSAITTWAHSQLPGPDFHRQDAQPYGLRADGTALLEWLSGRSPLGGRTPTRHPSVMHDPFEGATPGPRFVCRLRRASRP